MKVAREESVREGSVVMMRGYESWPGTRCRDLFGQQQGAGQLVRGDANVSGSRNTKGMD